jgi:hypothetical protein
MAHMTATPTPSRIPVLGALSVFARIAGGGAGGGPHRRRRGRFAGQAATASSRSSSSSSSSPPSAPGATEKPDSSATGSDASGV